MIYDLRIKDNMFIEINQNQTIFTVIDIMYTIYR